VPQRTTRGDIALRNLSDRVSTLEKAAARGAPALPAREQLVDALLTRAQFSGTFTDFERALEIGEGAVRDFEGDAKARLLRARTRSAVHRFDEATQDLEAAARLGADVDERLAWIRIAQGRNLEAARAFAQSRLERSRSLETLGLLAAAEAALGEFDAADDHFAAALATLHDVSPFPVAQLCFQRGVMWAEQAARPERALSYYAEAVRRLPQYVVANVHLAELEASLGRPDAAIQRLQGIVDQSEDPEPRGYLGTLLAARNPADPTARVLTERARIGYESLLARHRTAFLDHAAEFFSGVGERPDLASAFAQENLALRQTPRAYALAIEAAFAAQDSPLACRELEAAQAIRAHSRNLADLLERERARCATR
jgi:tetratricopeptide (TPR) repeat protein